MAEMSTGKFETSNTNKHINSRNAHGNMKRTHVHAHSGLTAQVLAQQRARRKSEGGRDVDGGRRRQLRGRGST